MTDRKKSSRNSDQHPLSFPIILQKLGGVKGVGELVDDFYDKTLESEELKHFFADIDMRTLRNHQEDFIVSSLSGTRYDGRTLFEAHIDLVKEKGLEAKHIQILGDIVDECLVVRGADDHLRDFMKSFLEVCTEAILSHED